MMLLTKSKGELDSLIPQAPGSSDVANHPSITTIKGALDSLDSLKAEKYKVIEDGTAKLTNL
jgi:hypothetical protein